MNSHHQSPATQDITLNKLITFLSSTTKTNADAPVLTILQNFVSNETFKTNNLNQSISFPYFVSQLADNEKKELANYLLTQKEIPENSDKLYQFLLNWRLALTIYNESKLFYKDIWFNVFRYLNQQELNVVANTCTLFHNVANSPMVRQNAAPFPLLDYDKPLSSAPKTLTLDNQQTSFHLIPLKLNWHLMAVANGDKISLVELMNFKLINTIKLSNKPVFRHKHIISLIKLPNSTDKEILLASGANDGTISIINVMKGEIIKQWKHRNDSSNPVLGLTVIDNTLVSAVENDSLYFWDLNPKNLFNCIRQISLPTGSKGIWWNSLISTQDKLIAIEKYALGNHIYIWNKEGVLLHSISDQNAKFVFHALCVVMPNQLLAVKNKNEGIVIYDLDGNKKKYLKNPYPKAMFWPYYSYKQLVPFFNNRLAIHDGDQVLAFDVEKETCQKIVAAKNDTKFNKFLVCDDGRIITFSRGEMKLDLHMHRYQALNLENTETNRVNTMKRN